jgi:hypothetical protein
MTNCLMYLSGVMMMNDNNSAARQVTTNRKFRGCVMVVHPVHACMVINLKRRGDGARSPGRATVYPLDAAAVGLGLA